MSIKKQTFYMVVMCAISLSLAAQQEKMPVNGQTVTTKSMADKTAQDAAKKSGPHEAAYEDPWVKFVKDSSYIAPSGERILRHEVEIDYPIEKAWGLFATASEGNTWMAPQFTLELKTGGKWWANYSATAKPEDPGWIKNTVLSYVPQQMISVKLNLVPGVFPNGPVDEGSLFAVLEFKDLGRGKTRVSETLVGFGSGKEWDWVYNFFKTGNRYVFGQYVRRIKEGPIDWSKQK